MLYEAIWPRFRYVNWERFGARDPAGGESRKECGGDDMGAGGCGCLPAAAIPSWKSDVIDLPPKLRVYCREEALGPQVLFV